MPGPKAFHSLRVNGGRMMETLHKTCDFGKAHPYGQ